MSEKLPDIDKETGVTVLQGSSFQVLFLLRPSTKVQKGHVQYNIEHAEHIILNYTCIIHVQQSLIKEHTSFYTP